MSDIVIRHAEPKDIDAIRHIHAQPEVYHNTLQVPHPSEHMWRERLTDTPGVKQLVACIDGQVVGHLCIAVVQRPRRSHVADFGISVDSRWPNRGIASALMRTMIDNVSYTHLTLPTKKRGIDIWCRRNYYKKKQELESMR
ncbi:GNAT family N-acetyltransferase, partial [Pseudomonas aeruginosa]|uniref:GNAT family N-acetyltransferase n=1 Tax=Pseudomonas aeruginosa TaxID=287 RepID=UPI0018DE2C80